MHPIDKIIEKDDGFTLLEVVLAIAILSIILISVMGYFSDSIVYVSKSGKQSQALQIARITLEQIKAMAYEDWNNFLDKAGTINIDAQYFSDIDFKDNYKINVILFKYDFNNDGNDNNDLNGRKIVINISWANGDKDIEIQSLVSKR